MQCFTSLGLDGLLAHFGLKIRLCDHPTLKEYPTHTGTDLGSQDGILRKSQINTQSFFNACGWQGHNFLNSISGWLSHPVEDETGLSPLQQDMDFTHPGAWA